MLKSFKGYIHKSSRALPFKTSKTLSDFECKST